MAINLGGLSGKRIPTIIGFVLLLIGVAAGVYAVGQSQGLFTRAGPTATPKNLRITNIREDGFAVSWVSDTAVSGFVRYNESGGQKKTQADDRDQVSGEASLFTTHYVTIRGLKPRTAYEFVVGSGSVTYDDGGKAYTQTTAGVVSSPREADTINGRVLLASGQPAPGVIVYVEIEGGSPLSALSRSSGVWSVPLSQMRVSDLSGYLTYDKNTARLTIVAQGADLGSATATTTTGNDSPVPDITLGATLNFVAQTATPSAAPQGGGQATPSAIVGAPVATGAGIAPTATAGASPGFGGLVGAASLAATAGAEVEVNLANPDVTHEVVATSSPEIIIQGQVGQTVTITVNSAQTQTGTVTIDADGQIEWTPPAGLEPGEHTVTLQYTDGNGVLQTITKTFTVLAAEPVAQGGLPTFSSTPSATLVATATPTPRSSMPSTSSGVPEPGVTELTLALLAGGVGLFLLGVVWQAKLAKLLLL